MTSGTRNITCLSRKPPYGSDSGHICLDVVLACAVYDQQVNYVFVDDGVYQLLKSQQPDRSLGKNLGAALGALDVYGVEKVYVDGKALEERNLNAGDLVTAAEIVDDDKLARLVRDADVVFTL